MQTFEPGAAPLRASGAGGRALLTYSAALQSSTRPRSRAPRARSGCCWPASEHAQPEAAEAAQQPPAERAGSPVAGP
eukprot:2012683-Alexandrium_andersonii.AAC.1